MKIVECVPLLEKGQVLAKVRYIGFRGDRMTWTDAKSKAEKVAVFIAHTIVLGDGRVVQAREELPPDADWKNAKFPFAELQVLGGVVDRLENYKGQWQGRGTFLALDAKA